MTSRLINKITSTDIKKQYKLRAKFDFSGNRFSSLKKF